MAVCGKGGKKVSRGDPGGDPDLDDVERAEEPGEGVQFHRGVDLDVGIPSLPPMFRIDLREGLCLPGDLLESPFGRSLCLSGQRRDPGGIRVHLLSHPGTLVRG